MMASLSIRLCFASALVIAAAGAGAGQTPWTSRDYVAFYFTHFNGLAPLPHLRAKESRDRFNSLIDPGNVARIEVAPVSKDEKLRQLRIILATLGAYRAAYNYAVFVGEPVAEELALVQAFALHVAGHAASLGASSGAWATLVGGVIESVGNDEVYSAGQRALMAEAVAKHYPAITVLLSEAERRRLRAHVLVPGDADGDPALHDARQRMKRAVLR